MACELVWNCWHFIQLWTWIHDNHCDLTISINSDTGQHLQILQCLLLVTSKERVKLDLTHIDPHLLILFEWLSSRASNSNRAQQADGGWSKWAERMHREEVGLPTNQPTPLKAFAKPLQVPCRTAISKTPYTRTLCCTLELLHLGLRFWDVKLYGWRYVTNESRIQNPDVHMDNHWPVFGFSDTFDFTSLI